MERIIFECETITPMFLAGADGKSPELRAPSIKGAMRFWWRAMHGNLPLGDLKREEAKIFGGSGENEGKSSFSIILPNKKLNLSEEPFKQDEKYLRKIKVSKFRNPIEINLLEYLAYGTWKYKKNEINAMIRGYISANQKFKVILKIFKNRYINDIIYSFYYLSIFGGLGSKSRNGFGNFQILKILDQNGEDLLKKFKLSIPFIKKANFLKMINQWEEYSIPKYTAFSKNMKIFKLDYECNDVWEDCLAKISDIYRRSRLDLEGKKHILDKRQFIGSPLKVDSKESFLERHSKPYFIKIIKENNKFIGYIIYLPSKYCEGLSHDRFDNTINHNKVNQHFREICEEFNKILIKNGMKEIINATE